jgi:hypothetical protein
VSRFVCLTIVCLCGVAVMPAGAQTAAGEITGLVQDQAGAAVPGAMITVTETRTNLRRFPARRRSATRRSPGRSS